VKEEIERTLVEFPERGPLCRCILAHLNAELGELEEARRLFDALAADRFAEIPPTGDRLVNLGLLSDVAVALNDTERAQVLYELLLAAAACCAIDVPEIFTGAVARNLACLAALMGRYADAEAHFEAALAIHEGFGARPWVELTRLEQSRMLRARDEAGDRER
jgi:hypothetical protein